MEGKWLTFRVENIPIDMDKVGFLKVFHSEDRDAVTLKSFCEAPGYSCHGGTTYTATVLFSKPGAPRLLDDSLVIDRDFIGLTPLYVPESRPILFDIIAVTGLGGHAIGSWAHTPEQIWLRDYLPLDAQDARIMTYGYASQLQGNTTASILWDYANSLAERLVSMRRDEQCQNRPILFIGHSLGCLIIKMIATGLFATYLPITGIIFFGAPHRGLQHDVHRKLHTLVRGTVTESLVQELKEGSPTLAELNNRFIPVASKVGILTVYETMPTQTVEEVDGSLKRVGHPMIMVTRESAIIYSATETAVASHSNHSQIARVRRGEAGPYPIICSFVHKQLRVIRIRSEDLQSLSRSQLLLERQPQQRHLPMPKIRNDYLIH